MEFPYRAKRGPLQPSTAAFHNAVVDRLRLHESFRRGYMDSVSTAMREAVAPPQTILVHAYEDIRPYSVFTLQSDDDVEGVGTGTGSGTGDVPVHELLYDPRIPRVNARRIDEDVRPDSVFITNAATGMAEGSSYTCWVVGDETPYIYQYDDGEGIPDVGDILGPLEDTFKLSKKRYGFMAVSKPYEEKELIWACRIWASPFLIGVVTIADIEPLSMGKVERCDYLWQGTGLIYDVFNPHGITLEIDLHVRWTWYPGWDNWIVEPWHYTTCEEPQS